MTTLEPLEVLYLSELKRMRSLAWMLLGDRASAEDAVHDCFLRMGAKDLADIENPGAYLRTAVVNECRKIQRKRSRFTEDGSGDRPQFDPEIDEFFESLSGLTPRPRTAIVLRYWSDLPVIEIARLMDCRPSSVSSLINRALKDLKEIL